MAVTKEYINLGDSNMHVLITVVGKENQTNYTTRVDLPDQEIEGLTAYTVMLIIIGFLSSAFKKSDSNNQEKE